MATELVKTKIDVEMKKEKETIFDVIGLGEIVVDVLLKIPHFPKSDEKVYVVSRERQAGGVTANFCVGVARQGLRVAFIGAIGNDTEGEFLREKLLQEGVDDRFLLTLDHCQTPVNTVMISESGEKAILQSEHMRITLPHKESIQADLIQTSRHLHLTAINFETAFRAVKLAKQYNLTISLDLESQVVRDYPDKIHMILEYIDFLLPNRLGAYEFTNMPNPSKASLKLLDYGPSTIIMTLGENGVLLTTEDKQESYPAFKVENVVDTTGAGDAFNAGFITGFLLGKSLDQSIEQGQATAALKIQGVGAQASLPTLQQLEEYLDSSFSK